MKTFQNIETPFVAPVDLQTLNNAYSNLQQRHDDTIKATSELKAAVANLDLNEAEDGFRNQLVADIQRTIDENTRHGNLASAYDNIVKLQGDIASNPALISKLRAQQDYKQFIEELDARTDLPEHYKEYYKRINPYKEGVYGDTGVWLKGTKWEPTKRAALNVDKTVIMDAALKYVTPNKGSYSVTTWMDANGNLIKNYVEGAKMVRYNTQTYQYETLTEQEIRDALTSVIRANPQYMDSLKQDYDIAVDDFEDGNEAMFNVNNGTGKPISFETFVDNVFSPMVKAKAYNYTTLSKEDYNKTAYKDLAAMGLSNPVMELTNSTGYSMPGENTKYIDNSYVLSTLNVSKGNNDIKQALKGIDGVDDEFINSTDLSNPQAFEQALDSLNVDPETKNSIKNNYNTVRAQYAEDLHNKAKFDAIYGDTKGGAAKKTLSYIISGQFPSEENMNVHEKRFAKQWQSLSDFYFPKGAEKLMIVTPNKRTYDAFVQMAQDASLYDYFELGVDEKGRYTISLDRSNNSKLIEFSNLYQNARDEGKKGKPLKHFWHELGSQMEGGFLDFAFETFGGDLSWGEEILSVGEHGSKYNLINRVDQAMAQRQNDEFTIGKALIGIGDAFTSSPYTEVSHKSYNTAGKVFNVLPPVRNVRQFFSRGVVPDVGNMLQPLTDYSARLNRVATRNDFGEEKLVSNTAFRGATTEAIKAQAKLDNGNYEDSTERTMLQNVIKEANESTFYYAQQQGLRNTKVKILNEDGIFETVNDSADIEKLQNQFRSAKSNDATSLATIELDKSTGRFVRRIQFNAEDSNKKKPITMLIDYDNVTDLTDLNKDPYLKSLRKFEEAQITNNDVRLGSYNGIDIYAVPMGDGMFGISADNSSSAFNVFNSSENTFELLRTVKEQEENILMYSELLKNANTIDDETLNQLSDYINEYVSNLLAVMNIDPNDQNARDIMYNDITRDTGFKFN